jgi:hypothetical protein
MIDTILPLIKKFLPFAQKRIGFNKPPRLFLKNDSSNANNPLGKTAYYDPNKKSVTLYVTGRHPKDVMRSLSHELVHHQQNCRGDFNDVGEMGEGYAQNDEHLREMEREAYETGNMCFRDWEDSIKSTIYYEHLQKGENKMSLKDWKNKEVKSLLSEAWGFKMDLGKLNEGADKNTGMSGIAGDDDDDTEMGHVKEEEELEEGCGDDDDDDLSEDSGAEEGDHYKDNAMHDDDHIKAIEHHLDALKHDRDYDDDHIDERATMVDAHPKAPGRRVTKPNGERVTTEASVASPELQKAILEVLRKHF